MQFFKKSITPFWKQYSRRKKIALCTLGILGLAAIVFLFFIFRVTSSVDNALQGNGLTALVKHDPLQKDENGTTHMLIFGNSSDDPNHGGALLADSIIVLSIDNRTKDSHTVSIPRDLWVQYGTSCANGSEGKINAYYQCILKQNGGDQSGASRAFADKIGDILGINIQYYAEVNYTFVKDVVDAVDGVDVVINSDDPRGILDRNFDSKCPNGPNTCYYVKYENGPAHLDGIHALYLARARNAKGGYGLPQSNFDREANQQMILRAVQKKALSAGVLSNPLRVIALADSLGDNIKTNIKSSELRSAAELLNAIDGDAITTITLNSTTNPLVTTGNQAGQSIVLPTAGLFDYSLIQAKMHEALAR